MYAYQLGGPGRAVRLTQARSAPGTVRVKQAPDGAGRPGRGSFAIPILSLAVSTPFFLLISIVFKIGPGRLVEPVWPGTSHLPGPVLVIAPCAVGIRSEPATRRFDRIFVEPKEIGQRPVNEKNQKWREPTKHKVEVNGNEKKP